MYRNVGSDFIFDSTLSIQVNSVPTCEYFPLLAVNLLKSSSVSEANFSTFLFLPRNFSNAHYEKLKTPDLTIFDQIKEFNEIYKQLNYKNYSKIEGNKEIFILAGKKYCGNTSKCDEGKTNCNVLAGAICTEPPEE